MCERTTGWTFSIEGSVIMDYGVVFWPKAMV